MNPKDGEAGAERDQDEHVDVSILPSKNNATKREMARVRASVILPPCIETQAKAPGPTIYQLDVHSNIESGKEHTRRPYLNLVEAVKEVK